MLARACRAAFLAVLGVIQLHAAPAVAVAQQWPQGPVRFILPLGPGSGADIGARLFGERLAKAWGHPVVIENRPGGDAFLAITTVTQANDDHVLLFGPAGAFTAHPLQHAKLPYDPADLVAIARVTNTIVSVTTTASLAVKTLPEFVALVRGEPGKYNFASVTGLHDFLVRSFLKSNGLDLVRVPYRDGVQAANDAGEGRIHFLSAGFAIVRPQLEAGKLKHLAVTTSRRVPQLPDLATVRELGAPELEFDGLVGLLGPRAMTAATRERIAADIAAIARDPEIVAKLEATGQAVNPGGPAEFAAAIAAQRAVALEAGRNLGVQPGQQ